MITEKLKQDLKQAMKDKDNEKKNIVRELLDGVNTILKAKELAGEEVVVTDNEFSSIVTSTIKRTKDALADFKKGNREDLVSQSEIQLTILESYLPKQLSEDEVKEIVKSKIDELGLDTSNKGVLLKNLMVLFIHQSDKGMINRIISSFVTKKA